MLKCLTPLFNCVFKLKTVHLDYATTAVLLIRFWKLLDYSAHPRQQRSRHGAQIVWSLSWTAAVFGISASGQTEAWKWYPADDLPQCGTVHRSTHPGTYFCSKTQKHPPEALGNNAKRNRTETSFSANLERRIWIAYYVSQTAQQRDVTARSSFTPVSGSIK